MCEDTLALHTLHTCKGSPAEGHEEIHLDSQRLKATSYPLEVNLEPGSPQS
jgi:hypothetical protein